MVPNDMYDPDVSVAVVSIELGVLGRGLGLKPAPMLTPELERTHNCIWSSSSDVSSANTRGSCLRWIHTLAIRVRSSLPWAPSTSSSSDVSVRDALSPEGWGTNGSPPGRRTNEGSVRGTLDNVAVLPSVIKLGVESPPPSHSLGGGTPAAIACAFNRRNIGTADEHPDDESVVGSESIGDSGVRVLWLPWVIVQMLVEVLSVPFSTPLTLLSSGLPLVLSC